MIYVIKKTNWMLQGQFSNLVDAKRWIEKSTYKEEDFYILKNTTCPSILTENGFYTNKEECRKMLDDYWRKKIALAHVNAIQVIENKYKKNI